MERDSVERTLTRQMVLIFTARVVAFVFVFALPLVLVRVFSAADYGLYKQFFLLHGTLTLTLSLGASASLFYFVPRHPDEREAYISQTLIVLCGLGTLGACLLVGLKAQTARALNNPDLDSYIPYLAVFTALSLITFVLEPLMIIGKQARLAAVTTLGSELLRTALIIGAAVTTHSVRGLVVATLVWGGSRLIGLLAYLRRLGIRWWLWPSRDRLRNQFRYSIPFGLATIVEVGANSLHQYVVSYVYNPVSFAIYSIGYLQIPLVWIAFDSISDVTLVSLTELRRDGMLGEASRLLGDSVTKLSLLLLPLYVWLMLNGADLIVLLYTERFASSVAIFMIFLTLIPLAAIGLDYVPRAFSDTCFLFRVNVLRLGLSAVMLFALIPLLGLVGAALATVLATAITKAVIIRRVATLLDLSLAQVLPWARLGRVVVASLIAGAAGEVVQFGWISGAVPRLVVSGLLFFACYAALVWMMGVVEHHEGREMKRMAQHLAKPVGVVIGRALLLWR